MTVRDELEAILDRAGIGEGDPQQRRQLAQRLQATGMTPGDLEFLHRRAAARTREGDGSGLLWHWLRETNRWKDVIRKRTQIEAAEPVPERERETLRTRPRGSMSHADRVRLVREVACEFEPCNLDTTFASYVGVKTAEEAHALLQEAGVELTYSGAR